MSNDNINGALSRDASRDVVMNVEKTLQEEIDNATRVSYSATAVLLVVLVVK